MIKLLKLTCIFFCCVSPLFADSELDSALASRRFDKALRQIDILLVGDANNSSQRRENLLELRARCLFELADYPGCEKTLRGLLATDSIAGRRRAGLLAQLARICSYQQDHSLARATIERALELADYAEFHRIAVSIALRSRNHEAAIPHLTALLKKLPDDPMARYQLGLVQLRRGNYQLAIPSLRLGLKTGTLRKDAGFELALALRKSGRPGEALPLLIAILEEDPTIERACYQAARCLIEIGGPGPARSAAYLLDYLKALKQATGPSSRDHHLIAAGKASQAWLARASAREALGDYSASLENQRKARSLSPASPDVILHRAGFFLRRGLLKESRSQLARLKAPPEALRQAIQKSQDTLTELEDGPRKTAALQLAGCDWADSEKFLEMAIEVNRTVAPGHATDLARLLLARNPGSRPALRFLIQQTRAPRLAIPHLHYLRRFCAIEPQNNALRQELLALRKLLLGS